MILFVLSENSSCLLNLILSTVFIMNLFIIISSRWHLYSKLKFHSPPHNIISHACIHTSACPTTFFSNIYNLPLLLQGIQPLLDGVLSYLPCPIEVNNYALDQSNKEEKVESLSLFYVDIGLLS